MNGGAIPLLSRDGSAHRDDGGGATTSTSRRHGVRARRRERGHVCCCGPAVTVPVGVALSLVFLGVAAHGAGVILGHKLSGSVGPVDTSKCGYECGVILTIVCVFLLSAAPITVQLLPRAYRLIVRRRAGLAPTLLHATWSALWLLALISDALFVMIVGFVCMASNGDHSVCPEFIGDHPDAVFHAYAVCLVIVGSQGWVASLNLARRHVLNVCCRARVLRYRAEARLARSQRKMAIDASVSAAHGAAGVASPVPGHVPPRHLGNFANPHAYVVSRLQSRLWLAVCGAPSAALLVLCLVSAGSDARRWWGGPEGAPRTDSMNTPGASAVVLGLAVAYPLGGRIFASAVSGSVQGALDFIWTLFMFSGGLGFIMHHMYDTGLTPPEALFTVPVFPVLMLPLGLVTFLRRAATSMYGTAAKDGARVAGDTRSRGTDGDSEASDGERDDGDLGADAEDAGDVTEGRARVAPARRLDTRMQFCGRKQSAVDPSTWCAVPLGTNIPEQHRRGKAYKRFRQFRTGSSVLTALAMLMIVVAPLAPCIDRAMLRSDTSHCAGTASTASIIIIVMNTIGCALVALSMGFMSHLVAVTFLVLQWRATQLPQLDKPPAGYERGRPYVTLQRVKRWHRQAWTVHVTAQRLFEANGPALGTLIVCAVLYSSVLAFNVLVQWRGSVGSADGPVFFMFSLFTAGVSALALVVLVATVSVEQALARSVSKARRAIILEVSEAVGSVRISPDSAGGTIGSYRARASTSLTGPAADNAPETASSGTKFARTGGDSAADSALQSASAGGATRDTGASDREFWDAPSSSDSSRSSGGESTAGSNDDHDNSDEGKRSRRGDSSSSSSNSNSSDDDGRAVAGARGGDDATRRSRRRRRRRKAAKPADSLHTVWQVDEDGVLEVEPDVDNVDPEQGAAVGVDGERARGDTAGVVDEARVREAMRMAAIVNTWTSVYVGVKARLRLCGCRADLRFSYNKLLSLALALATNFVVLGIRKAFHW